MSREISLQYSRLYASRRIFCSIIMLRKEQNFYL